MELSEGGESNGSQDIGENFFDDEDMQTIFNELYAESYKLKKYNLRLQFKLKTCEKELNVLRENEALASQLQAHKITLSEKFIAVEKERNSLVEKNKRLKANLHNCEVSKGSLEAQVQKLEQELIMSREVKVDIEDRSNKLEKMLGSIHLKNDKKVLGFKDNEKSKKYSKTIHVTGSTSSQQPTQPKVASKNQTKEESPQEIYFCTYCEGVGHFRKFCYQLRSDSKVPKKKKNHMGNLK
uniref:Uncharacterized protein n=1 Tax=Davidia involucrata TaxID=16924 RepID=A0A5B6Z8D6_DAVIN